ncbi:MAG TPA: ATP-binding cassette domain-containing protein [Verrucomicrobiae bacterium]|nr:ATP-binding cassette domain-containing protein [Verrucomicrobiae bacterium]
MSVTIKIDNLVKRFENFTAISNLNLEIYNNEIFGLLGPNGAGKTTLIHILATLIKPTSGTAIINGFDILKQSSKVRASIGIVFQSPSSDDMLTGYENLKIHSFLYNVPSKIRENRIKEVLDLVGLYERKNDQVKKYSGGMRRRLEIARGLLHKPKVLFLDEPTLGLDPKSRDTMWKYIEKLVKEEKITVILTTHYMEEADYLCDRIGIIDKGQIIALDNPLKIKESIGGEIIIFKFKDLDISSINNIENLIKKFKFVHKIENSIKDKSISVYVNNANYDLPILIKEINKFDFQSILSVDIKIPTLNDVFLKFTGKDILDYHEDHAEGGFMERYAQYGK